MLSLLSYISWEIYITPDSEVKVCEKDVEHQLNFVSSSAIENLSSEDTMEDPVIVKFSTIWNLGDTTSKDQSSELYKTNIAGCWPHFQ